MQLSLPWFLIVVIYFDKKSIAVKEDFIRKFYFFVKMIFLVFSHFCFSEIKLLWSLLQNHVDWWKDLIGTTKKSDFILWTFLHRKFSASILKPTKFLALILVIFLIFIYINNWKSKFLINCLTCLQTFYGLIIYMRFFPFKWLFSKCFWVIKNCRLFNTRKKLLLTRIF